MKNPGHYYNTDMLVPTLGVSQNLVDANLLYLRGKGLIDGPVGLGRVSPVAIEITPCGIDVVEHPGWFEGKLSVDLKTVTVSGDVYGQIAIGEDVTQIQARTFDDVEKLIDQRTGLDENTRRKIKSKLDEVKQEIQKETLSRARISELKEFLAKYDWLWPTIAQLIKKAIGLG